MTNNPPSVYVFILSDYQEDGAEHVVATLDRNDLMTMIDANWPQDTLETEDKNSWVNQAKTELTKLLTSSSDEDLAEGDGKYDLHNGWGGMQLHVRKLYRPST